MDISLRMVIPTLLLFVLFIVDLGEGHNWCPVRCRDHGPDIRPPFRLSKDQHGGFDLYCNDKDDTVLELSTSVKALVKNIDYISQSIEVTAQIIAFYGKFRDSIYLPLLSNSQIIFLTIPFSVVRQIQNIIHIRSIVLAAVATQFMLFLRMMTSTTCPYYRVQRCIPFHQFHMIYGVLILFNWRGEVKGKNCRFEENSSDVRTECKDKGTYCIISTQFPLL